MPNPTISDLHIDSALTDLSIAFAQRSSFNARLAFPVVPVMKQSNKFFTYDKVDWLRSDAGPRAPGAESPGGGWKISPASLIVWAISTTTTAPAPPSSGSNSPLKSPPPSPQTASSPGLGPHGNPHLSRSLARPTDEQSRERAPAAVYLGPGTE